MLTPLRRAARLPAIAPFATILLIAAYRLAPHPWNVAPVGALFALSGLYLGRSWKGWAVPFAAVLASDVLVYWRWDGSLLHLGRLVDYLAFALVLLIGRACAGRGVPARVAAVLAAPVAFYIVSNFGVWLGGEGLYAHTARGLVDCYVAALPFFRGTLAGDWLFGVAGLLAIEGAPRLRGPALGASAGAV
jgi:hypothetical protein